MTNENPEAPKQEGAAAVACTDLLGFLRRMLGEPIWTEDHDGEVRKSRLKRTKTGELFVRKLNGWQRANPDGTISNGYVAKWWSR